MEVVVGRGLSRLSWRRDVMSTGVCVDWQDATRHDEMEWDGGGGKGLDKDEAGGGRRR